MLLLKNNRFIRPLPSTKSHTQPSNNSPEAAKAVASCLLFWIFLWCKFLINLLPLFFKLCEFRIFNITLNFQALPSAKKKKKYIKKTRKYAVSIQTHTTASFFPSCILISQFPSCLASACQQHLPKNYRMTALEMCLFSSAKRQYEVKASAINRHRNKRNITTSIDKK